MKTSSLLTLPKETQQDVREAIKSYFLDELDTEIGDLQADLFIEFLSQNVGKHFYNQGVSEAISALKDKTDDLLLLIKE